MGPWFCLCLTMAACAFAAPEKPRELPQVGATLKTDDAFLQHLYDEAERRARDNVVEFGPQRKVIVEGGGYANVWLETQPMGGAMYANRDLQIGLNNQLIFMQAQRADGRLPGMIISGDAAKSQGWDKNPSLVPWGNVYLPEKHLVADYRMFQGYCFPAPALDVYYLMGRDKDYLRRLYETLEGFDAYLWRTRDSNGDGVLETWCVWDTGEDNSVRMYEAPEAWPHDYPPRGDRLPDLNSPEAARYWMRPGTPNAPRPQIKEIRVPYESMDIMAYSYAGRRAMAEISAELGNGQEPFWRKKAEEVQRRLIQALWRPEKTACYDRDKDNRFLETLTHNNLRCMWYGIFTQEMADAFIRHHLLNPDEFWTPMPLPSLAANDPLFKNTPNNSWSGQPQGLTYQRAIRALENYGHYAEVTLIGEKFVQAVGKTCRFRQQYDPFTGQPDDVPNARPDYGPTLLAALEYIGRMHGIHIERDHVFWSGLPRDKHAIDSTQRWGDKTYAMRIAGGEMVGSLNGRELFRCTTGVRVVTNTEGTVQQIVGITPQSQSVVLKIGEQTHRLDVAPNTVWTIGQGAGPTLIGKLPFDYPFQRARGK